MEELINLLHTGGYSCTIANKGEIRTFTQRGVADIYDLLTQEPEFLKGASIADKVVGKGAAALMILGGIKELYTDIISTKALELLQKSDIKVDFTEEVPFIWNRNHTGRIISASASTISSPPLTKRYPNGALQVMKLPFFIFFW